MNSSFALIDVDLPHAESFSIVWLNRPSTPSQRHTRCSQAGGFNARWSQVHTQDKSKVPSLCSLDEPRAATTGCRLQVRSFAIPPHQRGLGRRKVSDASRR